MELNARKGTKQNSEIGDGRPDGDELKVIGELLDRMYICISDSVPIPVFMVREKVNLTEEYENISVTGESEGYLVGLKEAMPLISWYEV